MEPADVVRALFAAFAARDVEAAVGLVHPDAEFWPQGTAEAGGQEEPYRGHAGIRQYFVDVERLWRRLEVHPGDLRTAVGGVVAFGTAHGERHDGVVLDVPVIWTFKLRDGRILAGRVVATAAQASEVLREAS